MVVRSSRQYGFTLVELLVVIAIIGILVALLLPAVQAAREAARRSECGNNLKQIGLALHNHHDTYKVLPPGGSGPSTNAATGPTAPFTGNIGWLVYILPFMEQSSLYDKFNFAANFDASPNSALVPTLVSGYQCPSGVVVDATLGAAGKTNHYYGNMGPRGTNPTTSVAYSTVGSASHGVISRHGVLGPNTKVRFADVTDGTSNTLVVGEISRKDANCYRAWTRGWDGSAMGSAKNVVNPINATPYNGSNNFNDVSFMSHHPGGVMFGRVDGSVTFVAQTVAMNVYLSFASRDGGESFAAP